jgi:hypothetical protein
MTSTRYHDPLDQLSGALGMLLALLLAGCAWAAIVETTHGVDRVAVCEVT